MCLFQSSFQKQVKFFLLTYTFWSFIAFHCYTVALIYCYSSIYNIALKIHIESWIQKPLISAFIRKTKYKLIHIILMLNTFKFKLKLISPKTNSFKCKLKFISNPKEKPNLKWRSLKADRFLRPSWILSEKRVNGIHQHHKQQCIAEMWSHLIKGLYSIPVNLTTHKWNHMIRVSWLCNFKAGWYGWS